jgi:hypothetical protein
VVELPLPTALQRGPALRVTQVAGQRAVVPLGRRSLQYALARFARLV